MSRVYLPYAEQFDLMNENLARIAAAIGSDIDVSTWEGIQKAVRAGAAPKLFPVGTQFVVKRQLGDNGAVDVVFDVVAHDYFKSSKDKNAYTMTLMSHDSIDTMQYDAPEAFYYADAELPAGTYNFTLPTKYNNWAAGTYQFTLTKALPKGGQLCISNDAKVALTSLLVQSFETQTSISNIETSSIQSGNGGTSLGIFGDDLNSPHRVAFGSNNYKESFIRQFLNSTAAEMVWTPQTKFDRPRKISNVGFANGFDNEFLSVIGEVIVPCSANGTYESPDTTVDIYESYTVTDKFYLASQTEIFGTELNIVEDDSSVFPYYKEAGMVERIKYRNGSADVWWLRSAYEHTANIVQFVHQDGSLYTDDAKGTHGVVPVCTIV